MNNTPEVGNHKSCTKFKPFLFCARETGASLARDMLFFNSHICNSLVLFAVLSCNKCDLITPQAVPPHVELQFGSHFVQSDKPWLAHVNSCFYKYVKKWQRGSLDEFARMWIYSFYHSIQPDVTEMLKPVCPAAENLNQTHWLQTTSVIGQVEIEPKSCAVFILWGFQGRMDFSSVFYVFVVHPILRVNFTFKLFQLHVFEMITFHKINTEGNPPTSTRTATVSSKFFPASLPLSCCICILVRK